MIIRNILNAIQNEPAPPPAVVPNPTPDYGVGYFGTSTVSGKRVSVETAKTIATAYRCGNILSDDIASMPFQVFKKSGRNIEQIAPDPITRNSAYLLEIAPNRWNSPFIFKKTVIQWLIYWGNAYIWQPPGSYRELFILRADATAPSFDADGDLWYRTMLPSGRWIQIPGVEMCHLMINSTDGFVGRSVITYAAETIGRQLGAHETQNRINGQGLKPSAVMYFEGELSPAARMKFREEYTAQMTGENATGLAILDSKIGKLESVTLKPVDAQFLETIEATDGEIANYFGMPLYKLNMGKQSYQSNEQQNLDYLRTTLNPYLVQWEQVGRLAWLRREELQSTYLKFIREALLQTDAKTRSAYLKEKIFSGQLSPNEARAIDDMSAYDGGDARYIPANMGMVGPDGALIGGVIEKSEGSGEKKDE